MQCVVDIILTVDTPLRKLRIRKGLTQREVAQAVGLDQGHYCRIERGEQVSPDSAAAIAGYFGKAITELHILYPERYQEPA